MQLQKLIAKVNFIPKKKKKLIAKVLFKKQAEELIAKVSYQYKYHSKLIALFFLFFSYFLIFSFFFFFPFLMGAGGCLARR